MKPLPSMGGDFDAGETTVKNGTRRALGSVAILVYLVVYIVLAASIGGMLADQNWALQIAFFAVAGIAWIFPLRPLLAWMGRGGA